MKNWLERLVDFLSTFDKKKTLIALVAVGAVLAIDCAVILRAQVGALSAISPEIQKYIFDIDTLHKDLRTMQEFAHGNGSEQQKAAMVKEFVTDEKIPELLEQLTSLSNTYSIKLLQINSSKEDSPKAVKPSSKKGSVAQAKASFGDKFQSALISLDLVGDYHNIGQFLADIDALQYMIEVQELKIVPAADNLQLQHVNLVLRAYVKK